MTELLPAVGESAGTADEPDHYQDHGDRNGRNGIDSDQFGMDASEGGRRFRGANCEVPRDRGRFVARPEEDRFWELVDKTATCWRWGGRINDDGYALFKVKRNGVWTYVRAHVWLWERVHGPVPDGHTLDHVRKRGCHHKDCTRIDGVNDHLEPVTPAENNRRAAAWRKQHPDVPGGTT